MIQAIDFIGSADQVTHFVRGYVDAGVEHPVLMPMPWGDDRLAVPTQRCKRPLAQSRARTLERTRDQIAAGPFSTHAFSKLLFRQ
jgi:hypothetical protein